MDKVVVTGADGFIGTHLVRALEESGRHVLPFPADVDIRDTEKVRAILAGASPELIIHLAAVSGPMLHLDQPEIVMHVNAVGTVNVLETARRLGGVKVVLASSVSGYTEGDRHRPVPASVYGVTKRCTELLADVYRRKFALPCTSVRIGSVYGIGRQTAHLLDEMIADALAGHPVRFPMHGWEPLVHVRDAASLMAELTGAEQWKDEYDLVTTPASHRQLAEMVAALSGPDLATRACEDVPTYSWPIPFDSRPLLEDVGREPTVSLTSGIEELIAHARTLASQHTS